MRSLRFMKEVRPNHWVIGCRACGKPSRRAFDSALECHEYWRDHAQSTRHAENLDPNHFSSHDADGQFLRAIFAAIPKRPDSIPQTAESDQASDPGPSPM